MPADFRDRFGEPRRQIEAAAFPVARQVLRALGDIAVLLDLARTGDADEGREGEPLFLRSLDELLQHADQLIDRLFAIEFLFVGVTPLLRFPYRGLGEIARLGDVRQHHASADVGAADVDRQDAVVPFEDPGRRQMQGADQSRFIGVAVDRHHVDLHAVGLENEIGARDRELTNTIFAQTSTDHDALGAFPGLRLEEAAHNQRQLLRVLFDRALDHRDRLNVLAGFHDLVELAPAQAV